MVLKLIVGLGNPGPAYDRTRHNAGFDWLDGAAARLKGALSFDRAYQGNVARINRGDDGPLWLLAPMTFMNLSGRAAAPLARFFKIQPSEILVVHDELDLAPGDAKLKQGGGSAGHNGLKDLTAQLGSPDYWRLRLGIGHPGARHEVADYVLRRAPLEERIAIDAAIERSLNALPQMLKGEMARAAQAVTLPKPPRPPKPRPPAADAAPRAEPGAAAVAPSVAGTPSPADPAVGGSREG